MTRGSGKRRSGIWRRAGSLAGRMLGLYARAHDLPEDTFGLGRVPHYRLTVNDYPTWTYPEDDTGDKLLLLEHADDSAVTILAQQGEYEGLQVQGPDGDWNSVPLIPGALQVFSGHLLARWTGGRLRPGRHRVLAGGTVTRRSTAVFVYPALETVVEPLARVCRWLRLPAGAGVGPRQGPGRGLPGGVRPAGADSGLARRDAVRRGTGAGLGRPVTRGPGPPREPKGAGADWTEERRRSDEGRRRLKGARRRAGKQSDRAVSGRRAENHENNDCGE